MDRCKTCPDNTNCVLPRDTCHHGSGGLRDTKALIELYKYMEWRLHDAVYDNNLGALVDVVDELMGDILAVLLWEHKGGE